MKIVTRLALAVLVAIAIVPTVEARGSKPVTLSSVPNTNYLPANLPAGFVFLDGSTVAKENPDGTPAPATVYVTVLCSMTTLRCVVQKPSPYEGKAFVVVKNSSGHWVPKQ